MPSSPPAAAPRVLRDDARETMRGTLLIAIAYLVWTLGDVGAKWTLPAAGAALTLLWRGVFGAATVLAIAAATPGTHPGATVWRRLKPVRWRLVALRCAFSGFVSIVWFVAWTRMDLIDSYAVGFTAPLIMTVLAIPMLHERIRWRRALSTAVGFAGVLYMLRPDGHLWTPIAGLLLLAVAVMAATRIMTRQLSTTETPECQAFWLLASCVPSGLLALAWFPQMAPLEWHHWAGLALLGVFNGSAHCLYARAYGLAPVSALAPYEYTMLIWGGALGWAVFGEVPTGDTLIGSAVIAAAGLYNLHRERVRARAAVRTS